MSVRGAIVGLVPLLAALAALGATFATGFDQNLDLPAEIESRFYGFFLDLYPLYAFAIVYGIARLVTVALAPGPSGVPRRILGALFGIVLVIGLSLHPTFGGAVLRGGFMSGSVAFLNQVPMPLAYGIGSGVAALVFGIAMGLGVLAIGRGWRDPVGRWRGFLRGLSGLVSRYLLIWYAFAILGAARAIGFGPWPKRPMDQGDALLAAACLILGLLPHALTVGGRLDEAPRSQDAADNRNRGSQRNAELREAAF